MQKFKELMRKWETSSKNCLTKHEYAVRLPIHDEARLEALNELYPNVSTEEIITDLISAGLDEMESSLPYIKGKRVIAEDDYGDPIFEDVGPSSTFQNSSRKHEEILHAEIEQTRSKSR